MQAYDRSVVGDSDWTAAELREARDEAARERDVWLAVNEGRIAGVMHVHERRA